MSMMDKIYEKVLKEFNELHEKLLKMEPEEILKNSYSYNICKDIVMVLEEEDIELDDEDAENLYDLNNTLEDICCRVIKSEDPYDMYKIKSIIEDCGDWI